MLAGARPRLTRLAVAKTALLVCDVQTRFADVIFGFDSLVRTSAVLVKTAAKLDVPVVVTEQYPKAFQRTVPAIADVLPPPVAAAPTGDSSSSSSAAAAGSRVFEKTKFSMCTDDVAAHLTALGCEAVVLCGLETHVCVLQTALDLLERGLDVVVCADAVSSQRRFDRAVALKRLDAAGAALSTTESVIFELLGDKNHPKFKEVSALVKENQDIAKTSELLTFE